MSKRLFSDIDKEILSKNINILSVTAKTITYHPIFKSAAVKASHAGKKPMNIFRQSEFNIDIIGNRVPVNTLSRWRKTYNLLGEDGLLREARIASLDAS